MALSYATILTRISQLLQDKALATFDATELGMWLEDELKRISRLHPLIVEVVFQVESRKGTDATGTASSLTDLVKLQFLAADATKEKVVHNITDDTWAVVKTYTSTSVLVLTRDIMDADEKYEIYNKRCRNKRQIYIGDMPPYLRIDSVEYPIGTQRNFKVLDDVIELDVDDDTILDSDSTLTDINSVDVLVRFAMPQILSQLTDWAGTLSADESEDDEQIAITGMGTVETIEVGEQFTLEDHRSLYIVTTEVTMIATAGDVKFYPPLEADLATGKAITFRKSTLTPDLEEILCQRVAARAMLSNTVTNLNAIPKGGSGTYQRERQWAMDILAETGASLRSGVRAKPYKRLPRI
jgi:hypothetical protein